MFFSSVLVDQAVRHLRHAGVIACATEAVYGLSCDPFDAAAVLHLLALKQRDWRKGLILVAHDSAVFAPLLQPLGTAICATVSNSWPGPNTWLLPDPDQCLPDWVRGQHDSVAVRVSAHPQVRALCQRFGGPLVSTSANLSGAAPARCRRDVQRQFADALDYCLPGMTLGGSRPSCIRDAVSGLVVRAG